MLNFTRFYCFIDYNLIDAHSAHFVGKVSKNFFFFFGEYQVYHKFNIKLTSIFISMISSAFNIFSCYYYKTIKTEYIELCFQGNINSNYPKTFKNDVNNNDRPI